MPWMDGSWTRGERAFVDAYTANGGNREKAEKTAKLAPRSGYQILARPEIQRAITQQQTARLTSDALPLAVQTLVDIMGNAKAPAGARVQAAKVVIDRAMPLHEDGRAKELHEMTPDELAAAISQLETAAAALAKPVEGTAETDLFGYVCAALRTRTLLTRWYCRQRHCNSVTVTRLRGAERAPGADLWPGPTPRV